MAVFSLKKPLFGKEVEFVLFDVDEVLIEPIINRAYEEGIRLQNIFNFYYKSSELSLLNKKRKLNVSDELSFLLFKSLAFSKIVPDYDVTKGKLFKARKSGSKESSCNCSYKDVIIKNNTITLLNDAVMIDLGSVAKGFIVDRIVQVLKEEGVESGIVDGRGDIRVFGETQVIGVQHPRNKSDILCNIKLTNQSVATSGDYNQYNSSFDNSHIINSKNLISVTVVADDLTTADLFATVLFVSDDLSFISLLNDNKHLKVMIVDKSMKINYFNNFKELIDGKA